MEGPIAILFLILPFMSLGQEALDTELTGEKGALTYIGAYFTPGFAFRTLSNDFRDQTSEDLIDFRNENETYKLGYTSGLTFGFNCNRNLGLETGMQYSNMGYQTKKVKLVSGDLIDPRRGFEYIGGDGAPSHVRIIDHFEYIGIPIALRYRMGNKKLKFSASLGCIANYLVRASSSVVLYYDDDSPERSRQTSDTEYQDFNITLSIGAGIEYQLNPNMRITAMPTLHYGALDILDAPI
ncbi:MAG: porin family protein, partial [Flavobacteriales bacterium]